MFFFGTRDITIFLESNTTKLKSSPSVLKGPGNLSGNVVPLSKQYISSPLFSVLLEKKKWRSKRTLWRGQYWPVYFFEYDGETLWGLSAYIVLNLLHYTPYGSPFKLNQIPNVHQ